MSSSLNDTFANDACLKRSFLDLMQRLHCANKSHGTLPTACDDSNSDVSTELQFHSPLADSTRASSSNTASLPRSATNPNLLELLGAPSGQPVFKRPRTESRLRMVDSEPSLLTAFQFESAQKTTDDAPKLDDCLRKMLKERGLSSRTYAHDSGELSNFFESLSIESYDMALVQAVRQDDVPSLREMWLEGRPMQCGNKFGESILHMACRRSSVGTVRFLLLEAGVSPRLCCDYGRTPLHDACWSSQPNFMIIELLLESCPDLLHIRDKRGFTPLDYVRAEQHKAWIGFLESQPDENLAARGMGM